MGKIYDISIITLLLLSGHVSSSEVEDLDRIPLDDGNFQNVIQDDGVVAQNDEDALIFIFDRDLSDTSEENFNDLPVHSIFRRDADEEDSTLYPDLTQEDSGDNATLDKADEQIGDLNASAGGEQENEEKPQNGGENPPLLPENETSLKENNKSENATSEENKTETKLEEKQDEEIIKENSTTEIKVETTAAPLVETTAAPLVETTVKTTTELAETTTTTTITETTTTTEIAKTSTVEPVTTATQEKKEEIPNVPDAPQIQVSTITYKESENLSKVEENHEHHGHFASKTATEEAKGKSIVEVPPHDDISANSTKIGESTDGETSTAGNKDTSILIFLFAAVVLIGLVAFAYNFIKKRRQRNADLERVERGPSALKRSFQSLTKADNEEEMKPLTGSIVRNSPTATSSNGDAQNRTQQEDKPTSNT